MFGNRPVPAGARIICDLSMGGTNPRELQELGAPENKNLKHLPSLHAKVYLTNGGLIAASANASNNGIGFLASATLIEAGSRHAPGSEAHQSASQWFERLWKDAKTVDQNALASAQEAWDRKRRPLPSLDPKGFGAQSLFGAVIADPSRFRGIGFAFTTGDTDPEDRDKAAKHLIKHRSDLRVRPRSY